jgi:hypothetical protein
MYLITPLIYLLFLLSITSTLVDFLAKTEHMELIFSLPVSITLLQFDKVIIKELE